MCPYHAGRSLLHLELKILGKKMNMIQQCTYMCKRKDGQGMVHNWPDNILLCKIRNSVLPLCICTLGLLSINHFRLTENQFSKMFSGHNPGQIFQKSSAIRKTSSNENRLVNMKSPEGDDGSKCLVRRPGFKCKE